MSFGSTFFSKNYSDNLVGETEVDYFWLFRYSYYIYIYIKNIFFKLLWGEEKQWAF